ncbi:bifunctional diguanylate cyclase/phosphodiesterase, partial [bacterium]
NVITDRLGDLADSQAKAAAIARIRREWQGERGYVRRNEAAFRLKDQGKVDQALREYLAVPYAPILDLLRAYDASTSATIEVERRKMTRAGVIGGAIALICSAGALVLAILLALRSGDVGRRLQRATRALSEVIRDDLTALSSSLSAASRGDPSTGRSRPERQPLAISGSDEAATLAASYNRLIDSVEEISGALSDHLGSLGHRDPLTGLPTRAELKHSLARAIAESKTRGEGVVAVVVLDVDGFKKINDSLGAAIGDELLKQIAGRLATCARESDMLARPGGDEFIVVLDAVRDRAHAAQLALEMIAAAERPYDLSGRELYVSMSAGLGLYPEDGNDIDELLQNADSALSRARAVQRSGFAFYEPAMRSEALEQLVLETDLRRALQSDEFEVYYQSILSTHSERIIGFEALLRWLHPSLGLMRPAAFLSTAEGMSLIVGIGKKVLHTACLQAKAWHQHGLPVRMNVNVSAPEFHRQDLYASVAEILHETGFPPHALELEITESLIMQDLRSARVTLRALRDLGIRIAIDDFGTGYSSLEYLRSLPIDTLKIDHSFVRGIAKSSRDAAFAKAIVAFAQTLDLRVIAEGV